MTQRILILGANGPTGRRTVQQALDRGYAVTALTRHPESFPLRHERLHVVAGDATDPAVIDAVVAEADAVICTIGAVFTLKPVEVYSVTTRLVIEAMRRHGLRRLIVVTSGGVDTRREHKGLGDKVSFVVMRRVFARTVYDDMTLMEAMATVSGLDWTIVRPPGLANTPAEGYAIAEDRIDGDFCSRDDLAALLLDQLDDTDYLEKVVAVTTPGLRVSGAQMFRQEILKR